MLCEGVRGGPASTARAMMASTVGEKGQEVANEITCEELNMVMKGDMGGKVIIDVRDVAQYEICRIEVSFFDGVKVDNCNFPPAHTNFLHHDMTRVLTLMMSHNDDRRDNDAQ